MFFFHILPKYYIGRLKSRYRAIGKTHLCKSLSVTLKKNIFLFLISFVVKDLLPCPLINLFSQQIYLIIFSSGKSSQIGEQRGAPKYAALLQCRNKGDTFFWNTPYILIFSWASHTYFLGSNWLLRPVLEKVLLTFLSVNFCKNTTMSIMEIS